MKKAKKQAQVMTQAIGESLGKPLIIREDGQPYPMPMYRSFVGVQDKLEEDDVNGIVDPYTIEFKPIKFEISVYVKFSLK
jgi:uncharacterized protein YggE